MGWKGTLRSIQAAQRRAERDARRRQRELLRQQKEIQRMNEFQRARYEVETYENLIEILTSVHKDCGEAWDWHAIAEAPEPVVPKLRTAYEETARVSLDAFEPTTMDKLLRRVDAKRDELEASVRRGKRRDQEEYKRAKAEYRATHQEWELNRTIARGVLSGNAHAYIEAIKQLNPFSEIGELGSSVAFSIDDEDTSLIEATVRVNDHEVLPRERKRLLKSGKLSVTNMPKTHFWTLYQDYVCGAALRVARELFAIVPVDMVLVTAVGELLNTQTGHLEEQAVLSVAMPRSTMDRLDFERLDPSDSMENFVHNMKFYKTRGFEPIEPITPEELER